MHQDSIDVTFFHGYTITTEMSLSSVSQRPSQLVSTQFRPNTPIKEVSDTEKLRHLSIQCGHVGKRNKKRGGVQ